jgi:hypothetical protein
MSFSPDGAVFGLHYASREAYATSTAPSGFGRNPFGAG